MMNDFKDFYNAAESEEVRMTYGIAASVLPMMAPAQFDNLLSQQKAELLYFGNAGRRLLLRGQL